VNYYLASRRRKAAAPYTPKYDDARIAGFGRLSFTRHLVSIKRLILSTAPPALDKGHILFHSAYKCLHFAEFRRHFAARTFSKGPIGYFILALKDDEAA